MIQGILARLCAAHCDDYKRLAAALDAALAEIDRLRLEVANLRLENRRAMRKLQDHELRMLRRAERDALLLGALHIAGGYTSKRQAATVGMGENRWSLARVVLKRGGALRNDGSWRELSADGIESAVGVGVEKITVSGIDALKGASYRHNHPRRRGGALTGAPIGAKPRQHTGERGAR